MTGDCGFVIGIGGGVIHIRVATPFTYVRGHGLGIGGSVQLLSRVKPFGQIGPGLGKTPGEPTAPLSAAPVIGPTTPSADNPCVDWKYCTAPLVAGPNLPSTEIVDTPVLAVLRADWSEETAVPDIPLRITPEYANPLAVCAETLAAKPKAQTRTKPIKINMYFFMPGLYYLPINLSI
jgi:hypothetical protein